jgi:phosphoglycolate phosphatase
MSIFGKRAHLRRVLRQSGVARERALYIGDQAADLEAARAEGIAFGAVSWGYGDAAHLEALGAQHRFDRMSDIAAFFKTPAESH